LRCVKAKAISRVLVGVWLSPVEHCVRDAGVAGSNPATPTKQSPGAFAFFPERFQGQPPKRAVSRRAPGTGPDQSAFCRIGKQATTIDRTGPGIADQETGD
jgi:hypothetical protein